MARASTTAPSPDRRDQLEASINYLIDRARAGDPDAFSLLVMRDQSGNPIDLAPIHSTMTSFTTDCWQKNLYAGILAPWRHGKTTLGPLARTLYEIGRDTNTRVRMVNADDDEAILRVSSVRRYIEQSTEFKWVFPHVRAARHADWSKHKIFLERSNPGPDATLSAAGVFTSEAGGGNDILMFDDCVTYQNSYITAAKRPLVYQAMTSVWLRRIDPYTRVLLVGTSWHADDSYQLLRKQRSGQWRWLIIGVGGVRCKPCADAGDPSHLDWHTWMCPSCRQYRQHDVYVDDDGFNCMSVRLEQG